MPFGPAHSISPGLKAEALSDLASLCLTSSREQHLPRKIPHAFSLSILVTFTSFFPTQQSGLAELSATGAPRRRDGVLAASPDTRETGRKEQRLLYLLVVERRQLVVLVDFSFASKEPELLLGRAGQRGRGSSFLGQ